MVLLEHRQITGDAHAEGRALLADLYRRVTGNRLPAIGSSDRGKPFLENDPLHFSITHTPNHVFCALSDRPIGIDAEEADRQINLKLSEKILSEPELAQYRRAKDKRLALLRFWVLKEAQAKYTGRGLTGYPKDTNFSLEDPRVSLLHGCLLAVIQD